MLACYGMLAYLPAITEPGYRTLRSSGPPKDRESIGTLSARPLHYKKNLHAVAISCTDPVRSPTWVVSWLRVQECVDNPGDIYLRSSLGSLNGCHTITTETSRTKMWWKSHSILVFILPLDLFSSFSSFKSLLSVDRFLLSTTYRQDRQTLIPSSRGFQTNPWLALYWGVACRVSFLSQ